MRLVQLDLVTYTLVECDLSEIIYVISKSNNLGHPGTASRDDAMFSGESLLQEQTTEVLEFRPADWPENIFFWPVHPFLHEVVFFIDSSWLLGVCNGKFQKKDLTKPIKLQAVTWGLACVAGRFLCNLSALSRDNERRSRKEPGRETTEKPCGFAARFRGFAVLCSRAQITKKIA